MNLHPANQAALDQGVTGINDDLDQIVAAAREDLARGDATQITASLTVDLNSRPTAVAAALAATAIVRLARLPRSSRLDLP